jgi:hypothetical protein
MAAEISIVHQNPKPKETVVDMFSGVLTVTKRRSIDSRPLNSWIFG